MAAWLASGIKAGLYAGYSLLSLNRYDYLRSPKLEGQVEVPIARDWAAIYGASVERRDYENAPGVTVYTDRNGNAWQQQLGLRTSLSPQWVATLTGVMRKEDARVAYLRNDQWGVQLSSSYALSEQAFVAGSLGARRYRYDAADPLISTTIREDDEWTAGVSVGRQITIPETSQTMLLSAGYSYRDVQSNVRNYAYDNHRITTALTLQF
jgi:uncharacterized protein (PEP-CTERM system associated)